MLLSTPNEGSYSGTSFSSSMVAGKKSRIRVDESASYVVSDNATVDIFHQFKCVLDSLQNTRSFAMSNVLRLVVGFSRMIAL